MTTKINIRPITKYMVRYKTYIKVDMHTKLESIVDIVCKEQRAIITKIRPLWP